MANNVCHKHFLDARLFSSLFLFRLNEGWIRNFNRVKSNGTKTTNEQTIKRQRQLSLDRKTFGFSSMKNFCCRRKVNFNRHEIDKITFWRTIKQLIEFIWKKCWSATIVFGWSIFFDGTEKLSFIRKTDELLSHNVVWRLNFHIYLYFVTIFLSCSVSWSDWVKRMKR